ncbi:hypothetical protein C8F01DRAFT_508546 [Mycena amicta]|nr:hypothetical protein C8F01DRAFT_508546 [Mycena amicta]
MFSLLRSRQRGPRTVAPQPPPPGYAPAGGLAHESSSASNAELDDYEAADRFCRQHPAALPARIYPPEYQHFRADKWGLVADSNTTWSSPGQAQALAALQSSGAQCLGVSLGEPFAQAGNHQLQLVGFEQDRRKANFRNRGDTCFTSNLPIVAGHYSTTNKLGVYFEITVRELLGDATLALGMQCLPYPPHRLPGWHRRSAALHLDDRRLYFEDSEGGIDYTSPVSGEQQHNIPEIKAGDTIGCGHQLKQANNVGRLFYTFNGKLLPTAFHGIFDQTGVEGQEVDIFAAVGVTNGPCEFDVNFGVNEFQWRGPNLSADAGVWDQQLWTVDGIFEQMGDGPPQYDTVVGTASQSS